MVGTKGHSGIYIRTKPSWSKGLTKETDKRVAKHSETMKGKHWKVSDVARIHISEAHKGVKYPNRKSPPPYSKKTRQKISKANLGVKYPREKYPNFGNRNKCRSRITKKKTSISVTKKWQDPEFQKKVTNALNLKPNNLEKLFDKLTPDTVRYIGNGQFFITTKIRTHNPDFKVHSQKKVIELFGDYWHEGEDPKDIIREYNEVGYKCLVFWEKEIYRAKNEPKYLEEILKEIKI